MPKTMQMEKMDTKRKRSMEKNMAACAGKTKYALPKPVRDEMIGYVRNYPRRLQWYQAQREAILRGGAVTTLAVGVSPLLAPGEGGTARRPLCVLPVPSGTQAQLERLDAHHNVAILRAVEQAYCEIGPDILSPKERKRVQRAIWESCVLGRNFTFEYANLCVSRATFYRYRQIFLKRIAGCIEA